MSNSYLYAALALIAGFGIPVMAALNASLGAALNSPSAAAVILFLVALLCSGFALTVAGAPPTSCIASIPPYLFAGGALVAFYVLSVTRIAPELGVANVVLFVLLGQLLSAAMIDHFGLFGAVRNPLSVQRLLGLSLIPIGVFLANRGM